MSQNNEPAVRPPEAEAKKQFRVIMLKSIAGSEDGLSTKNYKEGQAYVIGEDLYNAFVTESAVRLIDEAEAARIDALEAEKAAAAQAAAEEQAAADEDGNIALIGSETLPATIEIEGKEYAVGDIVKGAFDIEAAEAGIKTRAAWNELPQADREGLIADHLAKLGYTTPSTDEKAFNPVEETAVDTVPENKGEVADEQPAETPPAA